MAASRRNTAFVTVIRSSQVHLEAGVSSSSQKRSDNNFKGNLIRSFKTYAQTHHNNIISQIVSLSTTNRLNEVDGHWDMQLYGTSGDDD